MWDRENEREIRKLDGHTDDVMCVCFSPDGRYIASGSKDNTVRVWDWKNKKELRKLEEHYVYSVCFSPDGRYIVSGSGDKTVCVWDWEAREQIQSRIILLNAEEKIYSCALSNNQRQLIAGGETGKILMYDVVNLPEELVKENETPHEKTAVITKGKGFFH